MKSPAEHARELLNSFTGLPYPTSPQQAKYFAGMIAQSHIFEANSCPFYNDEQLQKNNAHWRSVRKELDKIQ